ncbi:transposase [Burkholderia lata]|nr:transposase [Burkholderia lata]
MENICIERFYGGFRDVGPNAHGFITMRHVTQLVDALRIGYDT